MKPNDEKFNWYGFNHVGTKNLYGDMDANLDYIGTFCIEDNYNPFAVYFAPNPNKAKGHKNYILFSKDPQTKEFYVIGREPEEIKKYMTQSGVMCLHCKDMIYSVMRHDMRYCQCGETFIDGGREYVRTTPEAISITFDFLNQTIKN